MCVRVHACVCMCVHVCVGFYLHRYTWEQALSPEGMEQSLKVKQMLEGWVSIRASRKEAP